MKLDFYRSVVSHIESNKQLKEYDFTLEYYRKFEDKWFKGDTKSVESNNKIIKTLSEAYKSKGAKKVSNNCQYLKIEALDAVIRIQCDKKRYNHKITEFVHLLHEAIDIAELTYSASHDPLTGILNRTGSEKKIKNLLSLPEKNLATEQADAPFTNRYIGLIAFDIDHFKQVNDSFGHQYGDAVLKSFAWRLEDEIEKVKQEGLKFELVFSRPGGEEFEILVNNLDSPKSLAMLAERFRECIEHIHLPDDRQLPVVLKDIKLDESMCPKVQERAISTSVGYSYGKLGKERSQLYSKLKSQADAALYRAKSDGRNCSRNFSDIVKFHGKVLDHIVTDNIVVIDIGRNVEVTVGNVFKVFSPDFSGKKPYSISDARSTKELGEHPRLASARVQVIDSQTNISFCTIVESMNGERIPKGSYLEYEIMGLDRPYFDAFPPTQISDLLRPSEFLREMNECHSENRLANLGFADISCKSKTQNRDDYLDILVSLLRVSLPMGYKLGYLKRGVIGFFTDIENHAHSISKKLLKEICGFEDERFSISIGALLPEPKLDIEESEFVTLPSVSSLFKDNQKLNNNDLLHIVRCCSYLARTSRGSSLIVYSESTVQNFLHTIRSVPDMNESVYEYHRFLGMGFNSDAIHMQGALIIFESQNYELLPMAVAVLEKALKARDKTDNYYILQNIATFKTKLGNYLDAYDIFKQSVTRILKHETSSIYLTYYAKSAIEVHKLKFRKISLNRMKNILQTAVKYYKPSDYVDPGWINEIRNELKELK